MEFLYEVTIIRKIPSEARLPALSHASLSTCTQQGCQGDVDQRSKKVECRVVVGGVPFQTLNPSLCRTLTLPALKTLGLSSVALKTTSHSPLSMIKLWGWPDLFACVVDLSKFRRSCCGTSVPSRRPVLAVSYCLSAKPKPPISYQPNLQNQLHIISLRLSSFVPQCSQSLSCAWLTQCTINT